jgi:hypothetical protein
VQLVDHQVENMREILLEPLSRLVEDRCLDTTHHHDV